MSEIKSAADMAKELAEHEARMAKAVSVEGDVIVINVSYKYEVETSRCDTPEKLLGWVVQLCEKSWMTCDVLERFILVAQKESDLKIDF